MILNLERIQTIVGDYKNMNKDKNIIDLIKFFYRFKFILILALITGSLIGFIYVQKQDNIYINSFKIAPIFSYSPFSSNVSNTVANSNRNLNQEFFYSILKQYNENNSQYNTEQSNFKYKIDYDDKNYSFTFSIFSPFKINSSKIDNIISELNININTFNKNLKNSIYSSFKDNTIKINNIETTPDYLYTDKVLLISSKMNQYINNLIIKHKLTQDLEFQNILKFYKYQTETIDLTALFNTVTGYLFKTNKINYDDHLKLIKDFSIFKTEMDEKSISINQTQKELSLRITPNITYPKLEQFEVNILEPKRQLQIILSCAFISLIISSLICFFYDIYKTSKQKEL
jgi:hypothetical protein